MPVAFLWSVDLGAQHARYSGNDAALGVNAAGDACVLYPVNQALAADVPVDFAMGLLPREYEPALPIYALVRLHSPETSTSLEFTVAVAARGAGDAVTLSFGDAVSFGATALPGSANLLQDLSAELAPGDEQDNAAADDDVVVRLTLLGAARSGSNSVYVKNIRLWQEIPA